MKAGALAEWLSRSHLPVELEVGSSLGHFICRIAEQNPDRRYVGVEIMTSKCIAAIRRATSRGLTNVCIVNMEAHRFVEQFIGVGSLAAVHIYFPTPNQHSLGDRTLPYRLMTPEFVRYAHRSLLAPCSVRLMTDDKEYADYIIDNFIDSLWRSGEFAPLDLGQPSGLFAGTPLERKYAPRRKIYRFRFDKVYLKGLDMERA